MPDMTFRVRLTADPTGGYEASVDDNATVAFSSLLSDDMIRRWSAIMSGNRDVSRAARFASAEERRIAQEMGSGLFSAVISGAIADSYRLKLHEARGGGHEVRVAFDLTLAPALYKYPWEFLYDGEEGDFVATSSYTSFVRIFDSNRQVLSKIVSRPLRCLAVSARPPGLPKLNIDGELTNLRNAALALPGSFTVDPLVNPTLGELKRVLDGIEKGFYDVIHFMGHGAYASGSGAGLCFRGPDDQIDVVSADRFVPVVRDRDVRLVVLNACSAGRVESGDPFTDVAISLLRARIGAVIAMQFEITDSAAIAFARSLYEQLAGSVSVDLAVARARSQVFADQDTLEWATPVLYVGAQTDLVLFKSLGVGKNVIAGSLAERRAAAKVEADQQAEKVEAERQDAAKAEAGQQAAKAEAERQDAAKAEADRQAAKAQAALQAAAAKIEAQRQVAAKAQTERQAAAQAEADREAAKAEAEREAAATAEADRQAAAKVETERQAAAQAEADREAAKARAERQAAAAKTEAQRQAPATAEARQEGAEKAAATTHAAADAEIISREQRWLPRLVSAIDRYRNALIFVASLLLALVIIIFSQVTALFRQPSQIQIADGFMHGVNCYINSEVTPNGVTGCEYSPPAIAGMKCESDTYDSKRVSCELNRWSPEIAQETEQMLANVILDTLHKNPIWSGVKGVPQPDGTEFVVKPIRQGTSMYLTVRTYAIDRGFSSKAGFEIYFHTP